jgi:hypothetical protein
MDFNFETDKEMFVEAGVHVHVRPKEADKGKG